MDAKSFIAVCFSDLAGQMRGHGVPRAALHDVYRHGLPWPAELAALTAFGDAVETPWDCAGGLRLLPDSRAETKIDFGDGSLSEAFVLGNLHTDSDTRWGGCTRSFLAAIFDQLKREFNLDVSCRYEHQFTLDTGQPETAAALSLSALRRHSDFATTLATVLENAGVNLTRFGAGAGVGQFTATTEPKFGVSAADSAVVFRQLAHASAEHLGQRCSFAPGATAAPHHNRLVLGIDLFDDGDQVAYDSAQSSGVSATLGSFIAGIVRHLPALRALTNPSLGASVTDHPAGEANGSPDRCLVASPASVSVHPGFATGAVAERDYSAAYAAADATACPYLQLGAVLGAGLIGLRESLPAPDAPNGNGHNRHSDYVDLAAALQALADDDTLRAIFPDGFLDTYASVKQAELAAAARLSPSQLCALSREIY